jgi:LAO/AO transport system kinase
VDPSSPFTKGAILGDRIRYGEFVGDAKVFVRSLGTRGSLGGLCASAYLMLRVFDACGFDVVLIETVGVGQTELDVMFVADEITVVVVPESGDSIQAMKAGLLEIADLFVVNKSDRPGADAMVRELEWVSEGREKIPVIQAAATLGRGIDEIFAHWMSRRQKSASSAGSGHEGRTPLARLRHEALALARSSIEEQLRVQMANIHDEESFLRITKLRLQIQT